MNVKNRNQAAQFHFWKFINWILFAVCNRYAFVTLPWITANNWRWCSETYRFFFVFLFVWYSMASLMFEEPLLCVGPRIEQWTYLCERCLDSNPESCRSKQARYLLSHPSPWANLATHLPTNLATHIPTNLATHLITLHRYNFWEPKSIEFNVKYRE